MTPREAELLLGGYATGILTEGERHALFEAALGNQALFNAMADEEVLRDLMADPGARADLLRAVTSDARGERWGMVAAAPPVPAPRPSMASASTRAALRFGFWNWLLRPAPLAGAGALAVAVLGFFSIRQDGPAPQAPPLQARREPVLEADRPESRSDAAQPRASEPLKSRPLMAGNRQAAPAPTPPQQAEFRKEKAAESKANESVAPPPPAPVAPVELGQGPLPSRDQGADPRGIALDQLSTRAAAQGARAASQSAVGLAFQLERRNANGTFSASGPEFREGDTARLVVTAPASGRLVVVARGAPPEILYSAPVASRQRVAISVAGRGTRTLEITLTPGYTSPSIATIHFR